MVISFSSNIRSSGSMGLHFNVSCFNIRVAR